MKNLLSYNKIGFAPIGELCAIMSNHKEGKTTFAAILAAAILKGERNRITCNVPDATVLYIDTECNEAATAQLQKCIFSLCGWSTNQNNTRFSALNLRNTTTPAERRAAIAATVEAMKPTAVIIDSVQGLAELDEADTTAATHALLEMAVKNECAIFVTMTTATPTGHARGRIASNLENVCTDIFSTKKLTWRGSGFSAKHTGRNEEINDTIFYGIPSKEGKVLPDGETLISYYYEDPREEYTSIKEYVEFLYQLYSYRPATQEEIAEAEEIITGHLARIEAARRAASTGWNEAAKIAALDILHLLDNFPAAGYEDYSTIWLEIEGKLIDICHTVLHDIFADIPTEHANN